MTIGVDGSGGGNNNLPTSPQNDVLSFFKVVVIGDAKVGKTSLMNRYIKGIDFDVTKTEPTIGVDFYVKEYHLSPLAQQQRQQQQQTNGNGIVKAQFWDTSGQERFRCISASFYRGANAALLVYDITSMESFLNMKKIWIEEFMHYCEKNSPIIAVVGNKSDQKHCVVVTTEMGKQYATRNNFQFFETSALNGSCVSTAFDSIVEHLYIRDYKRQQYRSNLLAMDDGGGGGGGIGSRTCKSRQQQRQDNGTSNDSSRSGCSC